MRAAKAKKFGRFFARMMSQVRARSEAHAKPPHCQPMVDIEHRPAQPGYSKPARAEATRAVPESQVSCAPAPRPGRQRRGRCAGRRENVTADGPERRALSGSALPPLSLKAAGPCQRVLSCGYACWLLFWAGGQ